MTPRPQESHADLGLVDDDRTPDLRPAPLVHHEGSAMTTTLIATTPHADPEYVADVRRAAEAHRLTFTVEDTLQGPCYDLRGIRGELIARDRSIAAVDRAMLNYWPASDVIGSTPAGCHVVRVDLSPAYADSEPRVYVEGALDDGMSLDETARLVELLTAAIGQAKAA